MDGYGSEGTAAVVVKFKIRTACAVSLFTAASYVAVAVAADPTTAMRPAEPPADCLTLLQPNSETLRWQDTMALEHCDRTHRLQRLSSILLRDEAPQFFETSVSEIGLAGLTQNDTGPLLRVVFPERVFFRTGSAKLTPAAREIAAIVADNLRLEPPDVTMFVAGHADARGSRTSNQALSVDRANAVAAVIEAQGTGVTSLWRVGFGEDMPLVAGAGDSVWGQNRRIEFLFASRPAIIAAWLADQQLDLLCAGASASQTKGCRASVELASSYEAVEVRSAREQVEAQANRETIDVDGTRRIRIDPVNRKAELDL